MLFLGKCNPSLASAKTLTLKWFFKMMYREPEKFPFSLQRSNRLGTNYKIFFDNQTADFYITFACIFSASELA